METESQGLFDLIFPREMRQQAGLTDAEANFVYSLWKNTPVGTTTFSIPKEANKSTVNALKAKGYLAGYGSGVELTERGKKVIVELATHEPNAFSKNAGEMSYSQIKAKASSRPIQALVKKQKKCASKEKEDASFNLHRKSVENMSK